MPGLYALRWGRKPELQDVAMYADELARARAKQGTPLVALFIMPQDSAAPDDTFRKAQAAHLPKIMSHVEYAVAVFEGTGFLSSLKRSALVAILLLSPKKAPVYVRATVEEALVTNPPGPIRFDAERALRELRKQGILTQESLQAASAS
jgi:hypothetical protein